MGDICYPVSIGEGANAKRYDKAFQTNAATAGRRKSLLRAAHGKGLVRCLCPGTGERRLAVRYRSKKDSYHLSRYPKKGSEHAVSCQYHSQAPENSGLGAYSKDVVVETSDGHLSLKLTLSLRKKDPAEVPASRVNAPSMSNGSVSMSAMTLGGLLHLLWTEAHLNEWSPGTKRWLGPVHARLLGAADRMVASGMRISNALVVAASSPGNQADENAKKVSSAARNKRRLIAIAPLAKHSEETEQVMSSQLKIAGFHGMPYLNMNADLWARIGKSYPLAMKAWRNGCTVVAIVQTDQPVVGKKSASAEALNVALMIVSSQWIPVESGYEWKIEKMLRGEDRAFIKPMRYDSKHEVVFPDFWLTDARADKPLPMEVYGLARPDYLARKDEKAIHYDREYGSAGWWSWEAYKDPKGTAIPPFPAAVSIPG